MIGTEANPISIKSNCFEITCPPDFELLEYGVEFSPEVDNFRMRAALLHRHGALFDRFVFDRTMYNSRRLPEVNILSFFKKIHLFF